MFRMITVVHSEELYLLQEMASVRDNTLRVIHLPNNPTRPTEYNRRKAT